MKTYFKDKDVNRAMETLIAEFSSLEEMNSQVNDQNSRLERENDELRSENEDLYKRIKELEVALVEAHLTGDVNGTKKSK